MMRSERRQKFCGGKEIYLTYYTKTSVADPDSLNPDPDPGFQGNPDPEF